MKLKKERNFYILAESGINLWLPRLFQGLGETDCFRESPESLLRASWELPESFLRVSWEPAESLLRACWESPLSFLRASWELSESFLKVFPKYFQRNPCLGSHAGVIWKRSFYRNPSRSFISQTSLATSHFRGYRYWARKSPRMCTQQDSRDSACVWAASVHIKFSTLPALFLGKLVWILLKSLDFS